MRTTVRAVADELASAAELALGKTAGRPVALVRGAQPPAGEGSQPRPRHPARRTTSSADGARDTIGRMKVGLQINSFTWPGGPEAIGPTLARIVPRRRRGGFDSIWVMDHFFQIRGVGRPEEPMLEGWTTLGFLAAHTQRARLGLMVGGVHYRQPGAVGQGGDDARRPVRRPRLAGHRRRLERAGVAGARASRSRRSPSGSSCSRRPSRSPTACARASAAPRAPFEGRHYQAGRLLNSPQSISRPRVPIMIGGGGERKTLRLVAQYADATNVFGGPETIHHKYEVIREHCAAIGRDPDEIERSTLQSVRLALEPGGRRGEPAAGRRPVRRPVRRGRPARDLQRARRLGPAGDRGAWAGT